MRGTISLLVNPFRRGEVITLPAGTEYISMNPKTNGIQTTKRDKKITLHRVQQSYTYDYDAFNPQVVAAGVGGYWNYYYITDATCEKNGKIPAYSTHDILR